MADRLSQPGITGSSPSQVGKSLNSGGRREGCCTSSPQYSFLDMLLPPLTGALELFMDIYPEHAPWHVSCGRTVPGLLHYHREVSDMRDSDIDSLSSDSLQADPSEPKATRTALAEAVADEAWADLSVGSRRVYKNHADAVANRLAERGVLLVNREQVAACIRQDCQHFAAAECLAALSERQESAAVEGPPPALAGHEHDWETCKQCAEVFDAGRG